MYFCFSSLFERISQEKVDKIGILWKICDQVRQTQSLGDNFPLNIFVDESDNVTINSQQPSQATNEEWRPPDEHPSPESDIFSLGCLFYFVLTGEHPFGKDRNELKAANLFFLKDCVEDHVKQLIEKMISRDPKCRPSIEEVCRHPLFWDGDKSIEYLKSVAKEIQTDEALRDKIDQSTDQVITPFSRSLVKMRKKLDISSVCDVFREIETSQNPTSALFWHKTFPKLFPAVYRTREVTECPPKPRRIGPGFLIEPNDLDDVSFDVKPTGSSQVRMRHGRLASRIVYVMIVRQSEQDSCYLKTLRQIRHLNDPNVLPHLFTVEDVNYW